MTINSSETSITKATRMDYGITASKIATLSFGEFLGWWRILRSRRSV